MAGNTIAIISRSYSAQRGGWDVSAVVTLDGVAEDRQQFVRGGAEVADDFFADTIADCFGIINNYEKVETGA